MDEKAYSGDIILVQYEDGSEQTYTVDMRLSDMGACDEDEDVVITTEEDSFSDDEYTLVEKVNDYHFLKKIKKDFLSKSNEKLLAEFKWGSEGEVEFSKFMVLVRRFIG